MEFFVGTLLFVASVSISFVMYSNYKQKVKTQEAINLDYRIKEDRLEEERIKQKRLEKRRKEKLKLEQEKIRTTLRQELSPYLQGFITQNLSNNKNNLKLSQYILKTGIISVKDLLDYQVERKLGDGSPYRVGLVKKMGEHEISLDPGEVEQLQKFFTDYFVLYDYLQSKGLKIDTLGLLELIGYEFEKLNKIS